MPDGANIPRIVIAATGSGVGKTTVTVAIIGALRARGLRVAAFKCGPDYLDPTYHERALGAPSHNLDAWMMGRDGVIATFERVAKSADIAVIEGMMGLFDGAAPDSDEGSTAQISKWLRAPVYVVCDASGIARTVAAIAAGFARFDSELDVRGLICNLIGGRGHLELLRACGAELPIIGGFPESAEMRFPERHLGLKTASDPGAIADSIFERWSDAAEKWLDLDAMLVDARSAPALDSRAAAPSESRARKRCRIGIAYDEAFHFYYEDNLARLEMLGAELVRFSPIRDRGPGDVDGIIFGGGYPEVYARELAANRPMLESIRSFAAGGRPIYAECGGLMYLCGGIRTLDGARHPMAGLVAGDAVMSDGIQAIGYVEVETTAASAMGPQGTRMRGHQFRYSTLEGSAGERIYTVTPRWGGAQFAEGWRVGSVLASYVHVHWGSCAGAAESFVNACARERADTDTARGSH
jgi:cobyrinic acid a,c-diamide synthase